MKKIIYLLIFILLFILSCSNEMVKNTIWKGSGTITNPNDSSISAPYLIEKAVFYGDGTVKFEIVSKEDETLSGKFEGNYTLDSNENLTFTTLSSYFACVGSGKLSYYGNSGKGKASCAGYEMTWKISKISEF